MVRTDEPETYDDVTAYDDDIALATYDEVAEYEELTAFNTYEAVVAVPSKLPVMLPVTINEPDIETDSVTLPVKTSYKSLTKLAEIKPPATICERFVFNTPIIILFTYKYKRTNNLQLFL